MALQNNRQGEKAVVAQGWGSESERALARESGLALESELAQARELGSEPAQELVKETAQVLEWALER